NSKSGQRAPVILKVSIRRPSPEIVIGVPDAYGTGGRQSQEEIGKVESGLRNRLAIAVDLAGEQSVEAEGAARVRIRQRVLLHPAITESPSQVMPPPNHISDCVREVGGLTAIQRCRAIRQTAEVRERQIRGAPIDRGLVRTNDA